MSIIIDQMVDEKTLLNCSINFVQSCDKSWNKVRGELLYYQLRKVILTGDQRDGDGSFVEC